MENKNVRAVSVREGRAFLNGIEIMDGVSLTANIVLETIQYKTLGSRTPSTKIIGVSINGTLKKFNSTAFMNEFIDAYHKTGKYPEITFQGISDDKNSDEYDEYGSQTETLSGCVLTGTIPLLTLDSGGSEMSVSVDFNAKDYQRS